MILFINVFLSNKTQGLRYDRGRLGAADRVDVFKYSLASLAPLTWSEVVIHYELAADCEHRRGELDTYIHSLFARPLVHHYQNQYQQQWQAAVCALEAMNDPLVWFCCNDDHVFVDADTALLERMESVCLDLLSSSRFFSCVPTHWPEYVSAALWTGGHAHDYFQIEGQITNSMQIVPTALLRYWWFEHDYHGAWMPRSDSGTLVDGAGVTTRRTVVPPPPYPVLVPGKELVRHFDGYSHVGVDINACPPLFIPDGFFSGTMDVQYGGDRRRPESLLVNPCKANYSTVDPDGADCKFTVEDLPMFWAERMTLHDTGGADSAHLLRARNEAVVVMATECVPVPASRLRAALRFPDGTDIDAELASLDAYAREWRLARYYDVMNRLRTAGGLDRMQVVLRVLGDADERVAAAAAG